MDRGADCYRRFLNGDDSAFSELVEQYGANLMFFINGLIRNTTAAEDLMEEAFCDLIFYKNRYKGRASFKTYLFAIARNKAIDYLKRHSGFQSAPLEDYANQLAHDSDLENTVIKSEEKRRLYDTMNRLKPEYHAVLHLFYFEDMSYEQIAVVLKKNQKQIKNLAYRAKQSLKARLEEEGFLYENL